MNQTPSCVSVISLHLFLSGLSPLFGHIFPRPLLWGELRTTAPTASYKILRHKTQIQSQCITMGVFQFFCQYHPQSQRKDSLWSTRFWFRSNSELKFCYTFLLFYTSAVIRVKSFLTILSGVKTLQFIIKLHLITLVPGLFSGFYLFPGYLSGAELICSLLLTSPGMRRALLVSAALGTQPSFPWQFWLISAARRELHKTNLPELER